MNGSKKNFDLPAFEWLEQYSHFYIPEPNSGCWLWIGFLNNKGYAGVRLDRCNGLVHKILYEKLFGKVPEGLELDHLCRVTCCINPYHLEPVTHAINISRCKKFITDEQVIEIKKLKQQGMRVEEIGKLYSIHPNSVYRYIDGNRRLWLKGS